MQTNEINTLTLVWNSRTFHMLLMIFSWFIWFLCTTRNCIDNNLKSIQGLLQFWKDIFVSRTSSQREIKEIGQKNINYLNFWVIMANFYKIFTYMWCYCKIYFATRSSVPAFNYKSQQLLPLTTDIWHTQIGVIF